jgi:signal transduction histidine kinase
VKVSHPVVLIAAWLLVAGWGVGQERSGEGFGDAIARLMSPKVREYEDRLWRVHRELRMLPDLTTSQQIPHYGFQSELLLDQEEPQWIQLDLRRPYKVDGVVLVPVDLRGRGGAEDAYGFPVRFKVEIGNEPDMSDAVVVADETAGDFPNPGRHVVTYPIGRGEGINGQFVRITSTKHCEAGRGFFVWALGEIMLLSGNYNVALGADREATSTTEQLPSWSTRCVCDGKSILELPVSSEPSRSFGFLAELTDSPVPVDRKELVVDLGEPLPVDEVRLIPARPPGIIGGRGRGFPVRVTVEMGDDPYFLREVRRAVTQRALSEPWNNASVVKCSGAPFRYVKVIADELSGGGSDSFSFALAELQVYSAGDNVALGKAVTASDVMTGDRYAGWSPEALVDGFSSQYRLIDWPEYLGQLGKRKLLFKHQEFMGDRRNERAQKVAVRTIGAGGALAGVSLLGLGLLLVRQKSIRRRDVANLRAQIARDLHDDLGSNLGSIALLAELGSRLGSLPEETRRDFEEIHNTAERSAEAMRDIVWLIDSGSTRLRELIAKMRETADQIFGERAHVTVAPEHPRDRELPLFFRRHVLFAFKEALNNARKHAHTESIDAEILLRGGRMQFVVRDDGGGFDVNNPPREGRGLANLRRRAGRLKGRCEIESEIGRGTEVRFEVPIVH